MKKFLAVLAFLFVAVIAVEGIIHNVIFYKIIIRKFLKIFREKHAWNYRYWQIFFIDKHFKIMLK
ncbi:MAG: hypothetical protein US83_C0002G0051 [Candidatus Falkowbacteria bacterium GW2011_GWC2_38_22]|uniref:Uncharacterized protein n=1 Tax=Candidatus Falkowbacteria bacterium GW2011_GWE1_38_31 TaxID=1618638 RepID=A0A0G0N0V7_9BACT|nr:MAG: hypothetical protein US73_C0007G0051 [Candidatus Falkowbacteria bacterium GW2011_GWF2_38_1205]KKQ61962.1 MAG: hypothetical protein US83_C0002G0051 [Candidatus Falkowbacteria bacterium GW2011_GWC2_38_22]KKQ63876.1 MAG: hypothetical protein US84_C0003G0066 [Candidatus Falkowbacteria bacterium GW2011_GWF1_38_22]KKQ66133.1 MAG: hypothetical protein US87_C0003G0066 [Candidatus Falkowbacteria bacterium GW2011_GWE2_38_254]KKQ70736.1 MAG: hypothetical protein US91_C0003G0066 [Candidatus Falkowb